MRGSADPSKQAVTAPVKVSAMPSQLAECDTIGKLKLHLPVFGCGFDIRAVGKVEQPIESN